MLKQEFILQSELTPKRLEAVTWPGLGLKNYKRISNKKMEILIIFRNATNRKCIPEN
jgi:hypothetical protein